MTLPRLTPVPPQPQAQPGSPKVQLTALQPPFGWERISRYVVSPAAADTSPGGDISMPPNYNHAKIIWRARDQSANTTGTFGGMAFAVQGGAIDNAGHYNWIEVNMAGAPNGANGVASTHSAFGGNNVGNIGAIVTQGGGDGSGGALYCQGEITFPFYSLGSLGGLARPTCHWSISQPNPGNQNTRHGSAVYWFAAGPLTKVRFLSGANNFETGTTFDLYCSK